METFLDASKGTYHNWHYLCSRVPGSADVDPQALILNELVVLFLHYTVVYWYCDINEQTHLVLLIMDNDVRAVCPVGQVGKHTFVPHDGTLVGVYYWLWDILIPLVGYFNTKLFANCPIIIIIIMLINLSFWIL